MKNKLCIFIASMLIAFTGAHAQNTFPSTGSVGIGTTTPNASSLLDVTSTTKGVLLPRMTKTQRDAIPTPATGLMIYQTNNTPGFYYYSGTAWTAVSSKGVNKSLSNLTAPTAVNVDLLPGVHNTLNLGSASFGWKNIYASGSYYIGTSKVLDITGSNNTFLGNTGNTTNTGTNNTFLGNSAGYSNTTGYNNTANGSHALSSNTTGYENTATGLNALANNTTGTYNTANGSLALLSNTTGYANTASGMNALVYNTTGYYNTANGFQALYSNSTGSANTSNGYLALFSNTTGIDNTAIGSQALNSNTTGIANTANGFQALFSNTTGYANIASGANALFSNTTGIDNTANGYQALFSNTTGYVNTASGEGALYYNTTGAGNTASGYYASFGSGTLNNTSCFGYFSGGAVNASNRVEIGNTSVSVIAGQVGFSTYSDERIKDNIKEDVPGLAFISKLRPVTYNLNIHKENAMIYKGTKKDEAVWDTKYDIEKIKMTGFLAQDVEKAAKESGYDFSGVQKPANPDELYSLRYSDFVMPLVKAVQELDQENGKLKIENGDQQKQIDELNSKVDQLQSSIENQKSSMTDGFAELKTLNSKPETILGQNIPNPFDNSTLIPFRIPKDCKDASIMITNTSTSEVISVIPISCNEDHVSIDAGTLASGTYSYTMYVDGKMIDTKSMVILR